MALVLIAGIGNIFLGDDGFGVEVARQLGTVALPETARVADFGIRGIHLAYDVVDRAYSDVILVDAVSRGAQPGTVFLMDLDSAESKLSASEIPDAHAMNPESVISLIRSICPTAPKLWLVGCQPAHLAEEMSLSPPVQRAIGEALIMVRSLAEKLCREPVCPRST